MKIAVCVKRVPEMDSRFKIAASGTAVDETGLKFAISDFDEWAVEAALQLKEKHGGEVAVVSLGPDSVQETIRKALAMGADRGVQLKADRVPFDGFAVARALAAELQGGGYDLIMFGKLAVDSSSGVTGAMVAELLEFYSVFHRETYGFDGSPIHDAVAVAHVATPGLVETVQRHVAIECGSELCRGRTLVDLWRRTGNAPNASVGVAIDADRFLRLLVERVASLDD